MILYKQYIYSEAWFSSWNSSITLSTIQDCIRYDGILSYKITSKKEKMLQQKKFFILKNLSTKKTIFNEDII